MSRATLTPQGALYFRTRLLPCGQAERFAQCLRGNDRFRDVALQHSEQAKSERAFFVTFTPSNPERVADMVDRQQNSRAERAATEGADYVYCLDLDGPRPFYWVYNPKSGETYELDSGECSCPDYQFRLRRASWTGLQCKHQLEMIRRFESGDLLRLSEAYALPEWTERHPWPQRQHGEEEERVAA